MLTKGKARLQVIATRNFSAACMPPVYVPKDETCAFENGTTRRTVAFIQPDTPKVLLYSVSTWAREVYIEVMTDRESLTLWHVFLELKLCVSRAITFVHFGSCDQLAEMFGVEKGSAMWAREYVFRRNGRVFLHVHEIFSPSMAVYLGDIAPPVSLLPNHINITRGGLRPSSALLNTKSCQ